VKKICLLILFFLNIALAAKSNYFEGFAEPYPVNDAKIFDNTLVLATANGVRFVDASGASVMRTSANGLGATGFASLAIVGEDLYAISENGIIARKIGGSWNFEQVNRSYEEFGANVVPGAVAVGGDYMVIAFRNKLAFFDVKSKSYLTSIAKIGSIVLGTYSPTSVLVSNDSLFIAVGNSVFLRKMDWKNLSTDRFLADPASWTEIPFEKPVLSMALLDGKLKTRSIAGSYYFENGREFSASEDSVMLIANGEKIKNEELYFKGKSRARFVLSCENKIFLAGSNFVGVLEAGNLIDLTPFNRYSLGGTYEMTALSKGGMIVSGMNSKLSAFTGSTFSIPVNSNDEGWKNAEGGMNFLIKALSELPSGEILYNIWGIGIYVYRNYSFDETLFSIQRNDGTCIENFMENFMVPASATPAPDGSGFLVSYWSKNNYGIAFVDLYGDVYCASGIGSTEFSGPMLARLLKDGSYEVFVASNVAQSENGNGSLDRFVMRSPRSGGELSVIDKQNLKTPNHEFPVDLAFASDSTLWIATYSKIGHWNSGDSVMVPHRISHFAGTSYSSIAVDPHGNLWISSNGDGLYRLTRKKESNDTLSAEHFKTRHGLINDNIYDLALDSVTGTLWMAHNIGVTMLVRDDLRKASAFMTDSIDLKVRVYPNPFRPKKHIRVNFEFVAENARISIFNAGGNLIKSMADEDLIGGHAEWDGRDGSGHLVAPGVYTYLITIHGKKKKQGKLLIIH